MKITVFTPTYNRGYIIENLYRSLQKQTFKDFEWIVIDDGSSDNTELLFETWLNDNNFFSITYKKVANGGKHRAINTGVSIAKGELFFIVDSDDVLPFNSLETIDYVAKTLEDEQKTEFCGICGQKANFNGEPLGTTFSGTKYLDVTHIDRDIKYNLQGDKAEVYFTEILKKYPFPEYEGEKFFLESIVWERMAYDGYKIRYFQDVIYLCEYLDDGLTAQGVAKIINNPKGAALSVRQRIDFKIYTGEQIWGNRLKYYYILKGKVKDIEIANNLGISVFALKMHILIRAIKQKIKFVLKRCIGKKS